ncbi:MAG: hypothetical protein JEZ12_23525 [Desulfobacterium sp.]|nr:hypothetical protein [Desulfobacterium sp.]
MSAKSLIDRHPITFTSSATELVIPDGTNLIRIHKLSDGAALTVEVNEQTGTPAVDAEIYQLTKEDYSAFLLPYYEEMERLFLSSSAGATCELEFRRR